MSPDEKNIINPVCPLCTSVKFQELYLINKCEIVRCPECGLVYTRTTPLFFPGPDAYEDKYFQNPAFENSDLENYFGYDIYLADQENIQNKFELCLRKITVYRPSGKLLELGCATGFFLDLARRQGFEVSGVEPSRFAGRKAHELFGIPVISQELREAGLPSSEFDVITLWDVIEHLPHPREEMREINRLLKPGGLLGIITPDIESPIARILKDKWLELRRVPEHLIFFSARTLKRLLAETGFRILEARTIGKKYHLDSFVRNLNFQLRVFGLPTLPVPCSRVRIPFTINPGYKIFLLASKNEVPKRNP